MTMHCMRSYTLLVIKTCHKRGVHAMGGMAAHIPIRNDPAANQARSTTPSQASNSRDLHGLTHATGLVTPLSQGSCKEAACPITLYSRCSNLRQCLGTWCRISICSIDAAHTLFAAACVCRVCRLSWTR